jgi:hypothetical protein
VDEQARDKEVFGVIEAAFSFDGVGMAVPPIGAWGELAGVGAEAEHIVFLLDNELPFIGRDVDPGSWGVAECVEVSHADEGEEVEFDLAVGGGFDGVAEADDVSFPEELEFFGDADAFDEVFPACGAVEFETAEEAVAARVEGIAELADGEFEELVGAAVEVEEFADAVDGHDATDGGYGGGAEEAMVAAGVAGDDGGGGEGTGAVGEEPLVVEEGVELAMGLDGIEGHAGECNRVEAGCQSGVVGGRAAVVVYCDFHVGRGQKE